MKNQTTVKIILVMTTCVICVAYLGKSLFDLLQNNESNIWALAKIYVALMLGCVASTVIYVVNSLREYRDNTVMGSYFPYSGKPMLPVGGLVPVLAVKKSILSADKNLSKEVDILYDAVNFMNNLVDYLDMADTKNPDEIQFLSLREYVLNQSKIDLQKSIYSFKPELVNAKKIIIDVIDSFQKPAVMRKNLADTAFNLAKEASNLAKDQTDKATAAFLFDVAANSFDVASKAFPKNKQDYLSYALPSWYYATQCLINIITSHNTSLENIKEENINSYTEQVEILKRAKTTASIAMRNLQTYSDTLTSVSSSYQSIIEYSYAIPAIRCEANVVYMAAYEATMAANEIEKLRKI